MAPLIHCPDNVTSEAGLLCPFPFCECGALPEVSQKLGSFSSCAKRMIPIHAPSIPVQNNVLVKNLYYCRTWNFREYYPGSGNFGNSGKLPGISELPKIPRSRICINSNFASLHHFLSLFLFDNPRNSQNSRTFHACEHFMFYSNPYFLCGSK